MSFTPDYKVFIQPLLTLDQYGVNTDVSTYVRDVGIGPIIQKLDQYIFDVGIIKTGNTTIRCVNEDGFFNNPGDLFTLKRDAAKVLIQYLDEDGNTNTQFSGLLNDIGTKFTKDNDEVKFTILSDTDILSNPQVETGDISNGDLFSVAMKAILNNTVITKVLGFDTLKINPNLDIIIDDVSTLIGLSVSKCLNLLLQASNSVFYVDSSNDMVVSAQASTGNEITFYGAQDSFGRDNITQITNYTDGFERIFNSIFVNNEETKDTTSITDNDLKSKSFTFAFIVNSTRNLQIGASYLADYKDPKKQLTITVGNEKKQNVSFLNPVELNLNQSVYNNIPIATSDSFKIVGFTEDPTNYLLNIFLREI